MPFVWCAFPMAKVLSSMFVHGQSCLSARTLTVVLAILSDSQGPKPLPQLSHALHIPTAGVRPQQLAMHFNGMTVKSHWQSSFRDDGAPHHYYNWINPIPKSGAKRKQKQTCWWMGLKLWAYENNHKQVVWWTPPPTNLCFAVEWNASADI